MLEKGCGVDRKAEHDAGVLEAVEQLCLPGECLVPDPWEALGTDPMLSLAFKGWPLCCGQQLI